MSQNTEQNERTRDEQVEALAYQVFTGIMGATKKRHEFAVAHILEAEARGAAEDRAKAAQECCPVYQVWDDQAATWEDCPEGKEDWRWTHASEGDKRIFYTRPANVAALEAKTERRFQHIKRGTEYRLIGRGKIQQNGPSDMAEVVIYQDVNDGSFWVRSPSEFYDGRFKEIFDALTREGGV